MNTKSKVSFIIVYIILAALVVVLDFGISYFFSHSIYGNAHSLSILSVYMPEHHAIITDKDLEIEKFKSWHEMSPNIEVQSELGYAFDTSVLDYLSKKGCKIEQIGERVLPAGQTNKEFMLYKCHQ